MVANFSVNFTRTSGDIFKLKHPTYAVRIVTGFILAFIGVVGGFGNSRVIFMFARDQQCSTRAQDLF